MHRIGKNNTLLIERIQSQDKLLLNALCCSESTSNITIPWNVLIIDLKLGGRRFEYPNATFRVIFKKIIGAPFNQQHFMVDNYNITHMLYEAHISPFFCFMVVRNNSGSMLMVLPIALNNYPRNANFIPVNECLGRREKSINQRCNLIAIIKLAVKATIVRK